MEDVNDITPELAKKIYQLDNPDMDHLIITENGDLALHLNGQVITFQSIITKLISQYKLKNQLSSFTLRVPRLIAMQVTKLIQEFQNAIVNHEYHGFFIPIYPLKVNPRKYILDTIMQASHLYGLEAGTKPEFILALLALKHEKQRPIICNGVKDESFFALIKEAMDYGYRIIISVETLDEARLALKFLSDECPCVLLRVRPYLTIKGHWEASTGRHGKFGLSIQEYHDVLELFKSKKNMILGIHSHPGSQITDEHGITTYFRFIAFRYKELYDHGFPNLKYLDVGGGLPINYDGTTSPTFVATYVRALFTTLTQVLPSDIHPTILIEAGRYITARHAMVLVKPINVKNVYPSLNPKSQGHQSFSSLPNWPLTLNDLEEYLTLAFHVNPETSTDQLLKQEIQLAMLSQHTRKILQHNKDYTTILTLLTTSSPLLKQIYQPPVQIIGNFSVFNTVGDSLLISQYFPILPIRNLLQQPKTTARLLDITCDSDGEISWYRLAHSRSPFFTKDGFPLLLPSNQSVLLHGFPVPNPSELKESYLLLALTGAYQDIIDIDQNLLGDLPDVILHVNDETYTLSWNEHGKTIGELLHHANYNINTPLDPYPSDQLNIEYEGTRAFFNAYLH